MSQVHHRYISLREVLRPTTTMVLKVCKSDPFWTTGTISISTKEKSAPDFSYSIHHYKVLQILHNQNAWDLHVNQEIKVRSADFNSQLNTHKQYYLQGLSKSYFVKIYENTIDLEKANEAIIFICPNWETETLEYTIRGAIHDANDTEEIMKLLAKK